VRGPHYARVAEGVNALQRAFEVLRTCSSAGCLGNSAIPKGVAWLAAGSGPTIRCNAPLSGSIC